MIKITKPDNLPQWLVSSIQDLDTNYHSESFIQVFDSKLYEAFLKHNLKRAKTISCYDMYELNITIKDFEEKIQNVLCDEFKFVLVSTYTTNEEHSYPKFTFINEDALIEGTVSNKRASIQLRCVDTELFDKLAAYFDQLKIPEDQNKSSFSMAMIDDQRINFDELKLDSLKFNPINYHPSVVTKYENIVEKFSFQSTGKLLIMQGPPGTGKTSLIRSLLHDLKENSQFIFLPTNMLTQLVTPSFLPALIRESDPEKSMILIIEDADDTLVERNGDNLGVISTLLNMTSGLLGDSLNIRVIATTNMKRTEIDSALTRPGRLFDFIEFQPLEYEQSQELYTSLGGEGIYPDTSERTLATIYSQTKAKISNNIEVKQNYPWKQARRKVGF
jgi:DNA replication protein DnaC